MINIITTGSKDFKNRLKFYLNQRKQISSSKMSVIKKIIKDVKKNKNRSLIKYEKNLIS